MSVYHLFSRLEKLDISLQLVEDKLKIDAPKGQLTPDLLEELKEKKEEIIEFLQTKVKNKNKYISIDPIEKMEGYILSSAQKRLYFLQQMDPKSAVYNMAQVIELDESPDAKPLEGETNKDEEDCIDCEEDETEEDDAETDEQPTEEEKPLDPKKVRDDLYKLMKDKDYPLEGLF